LIALFCLLPMLLKIIQPKRRIDTNKNEQKLGEPVTDLCKGKFYPVYPPENSKGRRAVKSSNG